MDTKKWIAVLALFATVALVAVWAQTNTVHIFRTTAQIVGVTQQSNSSNPRYDYTVFDGSNLVALAMGDKWTSNQVFALWTDCGSNDAALIAYDKSNSNQYPLATCANLQIVLNRVKKKSTTVNSERFVGEFTVQPIGSIAGGSLMVAGRLDLDSNGCPIAVLISLDKDPGDKTFDDGDVPDTDQDSKRNDVLRAGQGHMVGWLNIISGGTNTTLVPLGHLTFRHQLEQTSIEAP